MLTITTGVTIVQYRDKTSDTADLIKTAKQLHEVTQRHGVPLLINDRVDVAVAAGVEGVHLGQDDMGQYSLDLQTRALAFCLTKFASLGYGGALLMLLVSQTSVRLGRS